jgi:hypothetical protein
MNHLQHVSRDTATERSLRLFLALVVLAIGAMTLVGGCASQAPKPESMRDPQADFNAYRTFGWHKDADTDASGQPLSILDSNIRAAIAAELTRKGYAQAPAGTAPDLLVDYETARTETVKSNPVRIGIGVGSWGGNTGGSVGVSSSGVKNVWEGTLTVHAIDPARKAEVWNGRVSREVGKGTVDPAVVQSAVADLLRDFPARGAQP